MRFAVQVLIIALLLSFPAAADDRASHIGLAIKEIPLFDAHVHYNEEAWAPFPPETVFGLMDSNRVGMALVSSTPDEGTIMLWEHAPKRIVPELRPYHGDAGSSNWTQAPGVGDYIARRLEAYPHEGIGEVHLHSVDPEDEPLLRRVAKMAKDRDLYIHIHSDRKPVELLYSFEPDLKIIWAHAGMTEPADAVEEMIATYPTLTADTSYRERDILTPAGSIDPDWRRVLERFPDRFMVGTDTWINDQWANYTGLVALNRFWLSQFSRPVAEMIAYKNAERLFGRRVTRDLIGERR